MATVAGMLNFCVIDLSTNEGATASPRNYRPGLIEQFVILKHMYLGKFVLKCKLKGRKMRKSLCNVILFFIVVGHAGSAFAAESSGPPEIPVKDTVTMVDLGAKTCIPCKLMAPILEELKVEYKDRVAVIFIDVREDRSQAKRFGVLSIPTQIFYTKHGSEIYRHTGFMEKEKIKKWLDMLIERE